MTMGARAIDIGTDAISLSLVSIRSGAIAGFDTAPMRAQCRGEMSREGVIGWSHWSHVP